MVVPNASAFVNDPATRQGIAKSLANISGVDVNQVSVTLSFGTRRLSVRQLQIQSVIVDYIFRIRDCSDCNWPEIAADVGNRKITAVPLADLEAQILKNVAAVSGTTYTITVVGITAEATEVGKVVTSSGSMKALPPTPDVGGNIRVAGSSWLFVGALGLLLRDYVYEATRYEARQKEVGRQPFDQRCRDCAKCKSEARP
ncbi:unnamed protein product [Polarella glacialis]|uniref:Uncharacterized protein n=1 Tax=Polarella glacialis TaxID=89957 RepID=A0A813LRS8_POLGL|nr:unnamed protein product [Polarella glacialis]